jgi:hypothetical protein
MKVWEIIRECVQMQKEFICVIGACQIKVWYYYAGRLSDIVPKIVLLDQLRAHCSGIISSPQKTVIECNDILY